MSIMSVDTGLLTSALGGMRYLDYDAGGVLAKLNADLGLFALPKYSTMSDVLLVAKVVGASTPENVRFTLQVTGGGGSNPPLLGQNTSGTMTSAPAVIDGVVVEVIEMSRRYIGCFGAPENRFSDNRRYARHIQASARGASGPPVRVRWAADPYRDIKYHSLPGARVFRERADWDGFYDVARIEEGDVHAQFENLWDVLSADSEGVVKYREVTHITFTNTIFERVYLTDGFSSDIQACLSDRTADFGREFYDISFSVGVLP